MARGRDQKGPLKIIGVLAISGSASPIDMTGPADGSSPNCIWLGTTGNPVLTVNGTSVTFNGMVAGVWHPMPNFTHMTSAGGATGVIAGVAL